MFSVDVTYVAKARISRIYLLALVEAMLVMAWLAARGLRL
jgi:hypothetical protein